MNLLKKLAHVTKNQSPLGLFILGAMAVFALVSGKIYYVEVIKIAAIYAIFAMSWDILTGYTHEVNFGFAFFIGGAGYLSGILNSIFSFSLYLAIPLAALAAGVSGIFIGYLTLRLKGPYFAMATLAFASILFKLSFIFYEITGGEEGISSLDVFTDNPTKDFFVVWGVMVAVYFILTLYAQSKHGIILKAIRADEDATQSAGINTAYYKTEAFAISGFMAGIGGGVFAHSQMHIGPTMLSGYISIIVVLLAIIGGMGTIVGPLLGAICLTIINEYLRVVEEYRIVIYTGTLILLIYLIPEGLLNLKFVKKSKILSFIFLGDRKPT
ncbi:MAG: branched-chain amino acid ABC transporter permease [Deltaproteobacteria bacterium]|nr:branched-chain amino acid ABC transporter permease [Deltaproteobacteria bacterium]MBW1910502.1 branched-chain amino acid ABC transporter permease [Deltaproteobacteria bacterium]MBW2117098.1 branched-chain amino acid ABC transporter permease [Deltaproteobacteria bacterium]